MIVLTDATLDGCFMSRGLILLLAAAAMSFATGVGAQTVAIEAGDTPDRAIFLFGGALTKGDMGESANPFTVDYEDRGIVGGGYQQFFYRTETEISLGLEAGAALRFGGDVTGEAWAGPVIRYDGLVLFDTVTVSPALTVGLSVVSDTHPGREQFLEDREDGDASLLFYLGPEINLSHVAYPDLEIFWRLHHRSGAAGTLGDMRGAANANVIGFRRQF